MVDLCHKKREAMLPAGEMDTEILIDTLENGSIILGKNTSRELNAEAARARDELISRGVRPEEIKEFVAACKALGKAQNASLTRAPFPRELPADTQIQTARRQVQRAREKISNRIASA